MTLRAERSKVSTLLFPLRPAALLLVALASSAQAQTLPPRSQWQASSSSQQVPAMAIGHLIDGDPKTVTGGAFSPGHWFQIDLGTPTLLAGVRLTWDVSNPEGYSLQTSLDGTQWQTAYTMADSLGDVETLYFAPRQACYMRLTSPQRTSDWGVSLFEMEPWTARSAHASAVWMQRRQPRCGRAVLPSRFPSGRQAPMRSRSPCPAPSPLPACWSSGPMVRVALPDCRRRTATVAGTTGHRMRRPPTIGKAGWPPLWRNRCVRSG